MNQLNMPTVDLKNDHSLRVNVQLIPDLPLFEKTSPTWDRLICWMLELTDSLTNPDVLTVASSMRSLDTLARKVDKLLDEPGTEPSRTVYSLSESLLQKVEQLTLPVQHLVDRNNVFLSVQRKMVRQSYVNNTTKRASIYSLEFDFPQTQCTLDYLRPLLGLVSDDSSRRAYIDKFFLSFAQIVQILDDLVDLPGDVANGIKTPVSVAYNSNIRESSFLYSPEIAYAATFKTVVRRISGLSAEAEKCLQYLSGSRADNAIYSDFHSLNKIMAECEYWLIDGKISTDRLTTLIRQIPPVFCYG